MRSWQNPARSAAPFGASKTSSWTVSVATAAAVDGKLMVYEPVDGSFSLALHEVTTTAAATAPAALIMRRREITSSSSLQLVQKLFESTLQRFGVQGFSAVGKLFDPNLHEALMQADSDQPPGTVVQEMAKGYKLHDRLVRPAAVVVAKAPAKAVEATEVPGDP